MKRIILTLALAFTCVCAMASMSTSKMRDYARFLTDRMAYELDFNAIQYDDCYEINYDFLHAINPWLNDIAYGYGDAIERYYQYLDYRNDDLRYIMTARQYIRFMECEYFYRPIYTYNRNWGLRIHTIYSNTKFFYFDAPSCFKTYNGFHSRIHYSSGYYRDRYNHFDHYDLHNHTIHGNNKYDHYRKNDFGAYVKNRNGNKYDVNDYNNKNQTDRTQDYRYKDNSNNQHSHEINDRNSKSGNRNGSSSVNRDSNTGNSNSGSKSVSDTNKGAVNNGNSGATSGGTVRSGNRNGSSSSSGSSSNSNSDSSSNRGSSGSGSTRSSSK
ncbi:MAG: hypothetical protein MJZ13_10755 [Bacteroidales bacterium]|nr:hypothetical protein [Bacteroidales bacterium]